MSLIIDANMKLFADRIGITSSRMIEDYGLSTIDEIIEAETEKGNAAAYNYAIEMGESPAKLIQTLQLHSTENRFRILDSMNPVDLKYILPLLSEQDLVMGLSFFKQDYILKMLENVSVYELANSALEFFPLEELLKMFDEEDYAMFFMNDELEKEVVMEQIRSLPEDIMQIFIESVTGQPQEDVDANELMANIESLDDDKFKKFTAALPIEVQMQLAYQLIIEDKERLLMFQPESYIKVLGKLQKPDMIKSLIGLNKYSLIMMNAELPRDLMAVVGAQADATDFARFIQKNGKSIIGKALMI
ncbi:MAG: hypothetical protein Q4E83_04335 [bacterium]|nr:hypothetical protein [bacterium]